MPVHPSTACVARWPSVLAWLARSRPARRRSVLLTRALTAGPVGPCGQSLPPLLTYVDVWTKGSANVGDRSTSARLAGSRSRPRRTSSATSTPWGWSTKPPPRNPAARSRSATVSRERQHYREQRHCLEHRIGTEKLAPRPELGRPPPLPVGECRHPRVKLGPNRRGRSANRHRSSEWVGQSNRSSGRVGNRPD